MSQAAAQVERCAVAWVEQVTHPQQTLTSNGEQKGNASKAWAPQAAEWEGDVLSRGLRLPLKTKPQDKELACSKEKRVLGLTLVFQSLPLS